MRSKFPKSVLSLAVKQETVGGFKPLATVILRHKSKFILVVHTSKQTFLCLKVQYSTKSAIVMDSRLEAGQFHRVLTALLHLLKQFDS